MQAPPDKRHRQRRRRWRKFEGTVDFQPSQCVTRLSRNLAANLLPQLPGGIEAFSPCARWQSSCACAPRPSTSGSPPGSCLTSASWTSSVCDPVLW